MKKLKPIYSNDHIQIIKNFITKSKGLNLSIDEKGNMTIFQCIDAKKLEFRFKDVEDVLKRSDSKNEPFIQINFYGDKKIILTDQFIGFKPFAIADLDMTKLPKVVTTPDLLNFIEVIEDSMYDLDISSTEVLDIRRYFESILLGAEKVGFDLICERVCIERLFQIHPALIRPA